MYHHKRLQAQLGESVTSKPIRNFNIHPFTRLLKLRNYSSVVTGFCMRSNWKAFQELGEYTAVLG